ncbi:FAD-dependent monooxygenase [Saccharothrix longispora]|uniref:2-polyprenyl-6-methoxyphenol hydroxylase-like FAD-dependent oxidoreductase n=1 Tax=Saccharothrix longispora TaxID=33920 RepID=A0ABU1Q2C5_9PSEU|nr:FAD-dependent monooxygenase [Saccharothrix longispora]MDR6597057.1 2-polyprenyl-6-methoxyphenol hydroxylase-like FAD-dependent oxidoreductase [Saccharothrix longispora]
MRSALVIGGGIGGLTAAVGLHRAGWRVDVRERGSDLPSTGTGLCLPPGALRALDSLGVGDKTRRTALRHPDVPVRRPDGTALGVLGAAGAYLVTRPELLRVLASALPPGTIRFSSPADLSTTGAFDVVIGADGVHSGVRAALFGTGVRRVGAVAWRGTSTVPVPAGGETWGRGAKVRFTPRADGRTDWHALVADPHAPSADPHTPAATRTTDDPARLFADWHDPIPRLLAESTDLSRHDPLHLPPLPTYVRGRVALLGDAAHATTPDLGRGACEAIVDGVVLASCLTAPDTRAALRAYDRARRRRTQRLAFLSRRLNVLATTGRGTALRDTALRVALALRPRPERPWSHDLEPDELAG